MVHAEVVRVKHQQTRRGGIAQALLHSLFWDGRFLDSRVFHGLGDALRQADNKGQDYNTHSVFHDRWTRNPSNSIEFRRTFGISPNLGKNRFNTDVLSLTEYLFRIESEKKFVCHE